MFNLPKMSIGGHRILECPSVIYTAWITLKRWNKKELQKNNLKSSSGGAVGEDELQQYNGKGKQKEKWENSQAKVLSVVDTQSNRKQKHFALWFKSWNFSFFKVNISCVQTLLVLTGGTSLCSLLTLHAEGNSFIDKITSGPKENVTLEKIFCKELSPHSNSKQH